MTVEASLLVPFVFSIALFVLCAQLYTYNRCLLDFDCKHLAVRGAGFFENQDEILSTIGLCESRLQDGKYFGFDRMPVSVSRKGTLLTVKGKGNFLLRAEWNGPVHAQGKVRMLDSAQTQRSIRAARLWKERNTENDSDAVY